MFFAVFQIRIGRDRTKTVRAKDRFPEKAKKHSAAGIALHHRSRSGTESERIRQGQSIKTLSTAKTDESMLFACGNLDMEGLVKELSEGSTLRVLLHCAGVKSMDRLVSLLQSVSAQRSIFKMAVRCKGLRKTVIESQGRLPSVEQLIPAATIHSMMQVSCLFSGG